MANKFLKYFNFGGEDNYYPLPIVTAEQDGMVLKVVDGEWAASELVEPKAITFVISGVEYQMDEGMTWADWIASDYNTIGVTADKLNIVTLNSNILYQLEENGDVGSSAESTDLLIAGASYITM